jgi:predicted transcriptional regulator
MTAKEAIQEILNQASPDVSFEEVMYRIYLREKIERGLKDVAEGRIVPDHEVEARLSQWDIE